MKKKTVSITLPTELAEYLETLPDSENTEHLKYRNRKISNICSLIVTEELERLRKIS